MKQRLSSSGAFTIVELLVVIAIIALLAALLFPAVNAARASARRSTCQSNLRQVAMAVISYEASVQSFPPAAKFIPAPDNPTDEDAFGHSMYSFLLPYFEEKAVFDELQFDLDWLDDTTPNSNGKTNKQLTHSIHFGGIIECPAAPAMRRHKYTNGDVIDEANEINQTADYAPSWALDARRTNSQLSAPTQRLQDAAILQIEPLWNLVQRNEILRANRGEPVRANDSTQNPKWWGIMRKQKGDTPVAVRAANVRDGLSTTMLLFEAAGRPDHVYGSGRQVGADIMGANTQGMRWGSPDLAINLDEACNSKQMFNCHNWDQMFAYHTGGATACYADGSVEFVNQGIDPEVFVSLYTMAGSDIISESKR